MHAHTLYASESNDPAAAHRLPLLCLSRFGLRPLRRVAAPWLLRLCRLAATLRCCLAMFSAQLYLAPASTACTLACLSPTPRSWRRQSRQLLRLQGRRRQNEHGCAHGVLHRNFRSPQHQIPLSVRRNAVMRQARKVRLLCMQAMLPLGAQARTQIAATDRPPPTPCRGHRPHILWLPANLSVAPPPPPPQHSVMLGVRHTN